MAIDKNRLKEDATNILRGIGKFTPGGILKGLIEGNEEEILKVIRTVLSGTAPGRAAEAVQILVDRYKLPELVAKRLVANEMTDANMPVDPSGSADEGFPSRPEFESSAEDTSVPPGLPRITSEMLEDLLRNNRRRFIPLPRPISEGDGRNVIPLPRPISEGDGRNVIPLPGPSDNNEIGDYMFNKGGRVGFSIGGTKMASMDKDYDEKFIKLVGELMEQGFNQQEAIDEARERLSKDMAMGGRVLKQTGGITESRVLPPEFIEAAQRTYLTDLATQAGMPSVTTATTQQPGETAAQFAQRQAQAQQFGITKAGMADLAPQVEPETQLQKDARALASGLGSFQPFLTDATTAAGAATDLTGTGIPLPQGVTAGSIEAYTSPYQQQVIDTTMAEFDRQAAIRANQQAAATLGVPGAFGGGREGVQRAEYQAASDRNRAQTFANLQQQGFQNAAARSQQDLANQMGIANLQSGLGARAQDFSRAQISGLGTLGAAQQAQNQAVLDAQRQAAQMAIDEPRQALARFGQGIAGITPGAGAIRLSPAASEAPGASPLMKALGLGLAGADIYGRIFT